MAETPVQIRSRALTNSGSVAESGRTHPPAERVIAGSNPARVFNSVNQNVQTHMNDWTFTLTQGL